MIYFGEETLFVLPFVAVLFPILGTTIKWILGALAERKWTIPFHVRGNVLLRVLEDFALGISFVPVYFVVANSLHVTISADLVFAALLVSFGVSGYRIWLMRRGWMTSLKRFLWTSRWEVSILIVITVVALYFRLAPYWGLYVFDGDDIRQYTLLTQLLVSQGHLPTSWGTYALPAWYQPGWTNNHLIFLGTESVFAFLSFVVPVDLPQLTSGAMILFNAAIPLMGFGVVRTLFPHRSSSGAYATAALLSAVTAYPLFFLQWGGIDEVTAWVVLLGLVINFVSAMSSSKIDLIRLAAGGVFAGGLLAISPIVFAYALGFYAAVVIEVAVVGPSRLRPAILVIGQLVLGVALTATLLWEGIHNATQNTLLPGTTGWGTFATAPILRYGDWAGSVYRLLTLTSFLYSIPIVLMGYVGLGLGSIRRKVFHHAPGLALWALLLFLLNENGPFGLYTIKYPGWNSIFPDRPAEFLFVLMSFGGGILTIHLWEYIRHGSVSCPLTKRQGYRKGGSWRVAAVVALASILIVSSATAYHVYQGNAATVQFGQTVTAQDVAAFHWIAENVPKNSTILVNEYDSGSWIPEFDQIRVFPSIYLISNETVFNNYNTMVEQLTNTSAPQLSMYSTLGRESNLTYAYFGGKVEYGIPDSIPLGVYIDPLPVLDYASRVVTGCVVNQTVYVILLCQNNDFATIPGPMALTITLKLNGTVRDVYNVTVPSNESFTYVEHQYTPEFPGDWVATIVAQPLGKVLYRSSNERVFVLALNQGYFATACTGVPPEGSCTPSPGSPPLSALG